MQPWSVGALLSPQLGPERSPDRIGISVIFWAQEICQAVNYYIMVVLRELAELSIIYCAKQGRKHSFKVPSGRSLDPPMTLPTLTIV